MTHIVSDEGVFIEMKEELLENLHDRIRYYTSEDVIKGMLDYGLVGAENVLRVTFGEDGYNYNNYQSVNISIGRDTYIDFIF